VRVELAEGAEHDQVGAGEAIAASGLQIVPPTRMFQHFTAWRSTAAAPPKVLVMRRH
jgi:hypothetical protein